VFGPHSAFDHPDFLFELKHDGFRQTTLYNGKIPLDQVRAAFSKKSNSVNLENTENEVAA
jgi:hypothetical protein